MNHRAMNFSDSLGKTLYDIPSFKPSKIFRIPKLPGFLGGSKPTAFVSLESTEEMENQEERFDFLVTLAKVCWKTLESGRVVKQWCAR